MTREEAQFNLEVLKQFIIGKPFSGHEDWEALDMAIEALSEPNMIPIKLEKRYPESRDEDITDAFMQGYLKGKADRPQGEWIMHIDDMFPCESTQECSVCHAQLTMMTSVVGEKGDSHE